MNDGGPAFPVIKNIFKPDPKFPDGPVYHVGTEPCYGISIRDYFAAKAMQGMYANVGCNSWADATLAERAFLIADEMLKAREKGREAL